MPSIVVVSAMASVPAKEHASGPPFEVPEGYTVDTRLDPWESRTHTVENFLKRKLCPALKEHGAAAAALFEESATVILPGATDIPI